MKAFAQKVLDGLAVDYADLRIEEYEVTRIGYRGKQLEDIARNYEKGGCLRVFVRGNWGIATFNRVDDSLAELARTTAASTALLPVRPERLTALGAHSARVTVSPADDTRAVPLERKRDLIESYNRILLAHPGIVTTFAVYQDVFKRNFFHSTEGRTIEEERCYPGFMVTAVAKDGSNVQDYSDSVGRTRGFEDLVGREAAVEDVARIALDLLKAEKVKAGQYTVIIDPKLCGVFAHEAFGHLSEADFLYQNERFRELMKVGTRFGNDDLSIVDDATVPGARGSFAYDEEGTPAARTDLIRDGMLAGHLHNRETADAMAEPLTGNGRAINYRFPPIVRMTNTFIEPGKRSRDELMAGITDGLYICGARGGMTELESFTFSSQYAYEIKNGKLGAMVRDAILAGNIFDTLKNIDGIGSDLALFGGLGGCGKSEQSPLPVGLGGPHVRIRNVVIGGR